MTSTLDELHIVDTLARLEELYAKPGWVAFASEINHVNSHYRAYIEIAPFVVLTTQGPQGPDSSGRGDFPGFVKILDEKTLLIPDRRGNNRIDALRNIIRDPRIALLFLIPGRRELLRIKGRAKISTDPALLDLYANGNGKPPKTAIVISVASVDYQCAAAIKRAQLWRHLEVEPKLPSPNAILAGVKWRGFRRSLTQSIQGRTAP